MIFEFQKFFESINPLAGFKDKDDLETYLYEQSNKIEPKDGEIQHVVCLNFSKNIINFFCF